MAFYAKNDYLRPSFLYQIPQPMETRNTTLDIAKGISILLMTITHMDVFYHYQTITGFNAHVLMIFKMPLFIFISGYLFSARGSVLEFSIAKLDGLIKPVATIFAVTAVVVVPVMLARGVAIGDLLYGTIVKLSALYMLLWFPITLFVALVIFRVMLHLYQKNRALAAMVGMALLFVLNLFTRTEFNLYLLELYSLPYFLIFLSLGYAVKRQNLLDNLLRPLSFLFFAALFVSTILLRNHLGSKIDLNGNIFGTFFPTMVSSLAGILLMINISRRLSRIPGLSSILVTCSRASFYILAFCRPLGNLVIRPFVLSLMPRNALSEAITYLITISLCVLCHRAITRTRYLKYLMLPLKSFGAKIQYGNRRSQIAMNRS